ncbi:hypothetical protein [Luteimonas sp. FCS-9]|uniref:hypothetical protein n=1 Tax=Luteimonas sp. FCS-9 TaxID=1547516 RepID=UPI00063EA623|nr:hypothetical protein [Luteimonas sp. FCS-9]KLJ00553.1 hypothetical protein WQ56_08870 [Luteimonas sp. FCS-9]
MTEISLTATYAANMQRATLDASQGTDGARSGAGGALSSKYGGFLMTIAKVLGDKLDEMSKDLQDFADKLGKEPTASETTELSGMSQMFQMFMNNASTVIKSLGEANAGMARKQ